MSVDCEFIFYRHRTKFVVHRDENDSLVLRASFRMHFESMKIKNMQMKFKKKSFSITSADVQSIRYS